MPGYRDVPTIVTAFDLRGLSRVDEAFKAVASGKVRLVVVAQKVVQPLPGCLSAEG